MHHDAPGERVSGRSAARLKIKVSWSENAVRVLAGTGGEWPRARGLLSLDRAWAVADLQRRRRGQPRAWRVLRARRLRLRRNHKISWFWAGGGDLSACG